MAKRFTDVLKWQDPWYRKLSPKLKSLWQYICDTCDNAGVWKVDFDAASFHIGEPVAIEDVQFLNHEKERLVPVNSNYLIIRDFISFQIGNINSKKFKKQTNLQKSCIYLINQYVNRGIDIPKILNLTGTLPVAYGYRTGIKYKGIKDNGKGKGIKDKNNGKIDIPPSLDAVRLYCVERNNGINPESFIDFYAARGWLIGKNKMKDWRAAIRTWEQRKKELTNGKDRGSIEQKYAGVEREV